MGDRNIRKTVLLNALAALSSVVPASDAKSDLLILPYGPDSSLEQLLSGKPVGAGGSLSQDLPLLNDAESVFLRWKDAQASPLAKEVQTLLVPAQSQQVQVQSAPASTDDAAPAVDRNSTAIDASAGETVAGGFSDGPGSKGDMALSSGMTNKPGSDLKNDGSSGRDEKSDFAPPAITFEAVGSAAAVLVFLWFVLLVVIILVHAEQKGQRRRQHYTLHAVLRRSPSSIMKPPAREEWELRAQSKALAAYEQHLRDQASNVNAGQGVVRAA